MEKPSDRFIPYYFVAFFVVLTIILGSFVYVAVESHKTVAMERD
jgi:hypothetical protein